MYRQIKINSNKSVNTINKDSFMDININRTNNVIPLNDISYNISQNNIYKEERQKSQLYRLNGAIIPTFTNVLHNVTYLESDINKRGVNYLFTDAFTDLRYIQRGFITAKESLKENLLEQNGWFGYYEPDDPSIIESDPCIFNSFYPQPEHFDILKDNWDISFVYPYSATTNHLIDGGILLAHGEIITLNQREYILFTTPIKHNLQPGNKVKLNNIYSGLTDNIYTVTNIGDGGGYDLDYKFYISLPKTTTTFTLGINARVIKRYHNQDSIYYQRLGKKIDVQIDIYPMAFERGIYNDDIIGYSTINDINLSGITDNLNRPISEIYLRLIKLETNLFNVNGVADGVLFTKPIDGINTPELTSTNNSSIISNFNIHTVTTEFNALSGFINPEDDATIIDIVEYNILTQKEVTLGDINHRFNTVERDDINRLEGYFYQPYYKLPILDYSQYIEQGDISTIGIPDYASEFVSGNFLWRDLLEKGYTKNTDYPFLNGRHYIYNKFSLNLLRQDPYGNYGLYHGLFPKDPFGYILKDNKYVIKRAGNGCK